VLESLWLRVACVAVAGALGALARWGTGYAVASTLGKQWPFGTLVVNALGCAFFGIVMGYLKPERAHEPAFELTRLLLLTGFCGAYTTYSTFAFDVVELHATRGAWAALGNIAAQLAIGLAAVALGVAAGRLLS
jgi:CrcB protein